MKRAAQPVDAIRQRIERVAIAEARRQVGQREERAGQEEDRHDQEVHDQLKALHVLQRRANRRAERREHDAMSAMNSRASGSVADVRRPESGDQADDRRPAAPG